MSAAAVRRWSWRCQATGITPDIVMESVRVQPGMAHEPRGIREENLPGHLDRRTPAKEEEPGDKRVD